MLKQKHYAWHVRIQQEGEHFRVYCQHHYPRGIVEKERNVIHVALTRWRKQNSSLKACDAPIVFSQSWTRAFRPCDIFYCAFLRCKKHSNPGAFVTKYSDLVTKNSYC